MKNVTKILVVATAAVLFAVASCQKDENGNRITYYNKKTGEGYVFYKFENDSIAPITNAKTQIQSYRMGMFSTITVHSDCIYTDNNGKYSFKFVKKIKGEKVEEHHISLQSFPNKPDGISSPSITLKSDSDLLRNSNKIVLDTIFFYPGIRFPSEIY